MQSIIDNITPDKDLFNCIENVEKNKTDLMLLASPYIKNSFKKFLNYKNPIYTRECMFRNQTFEIILITWYPKSISPIHNHSENGCLMFLVNGSLREERFNNSYENVDTVDIEDKNVHYIHNREGLHRISNITDDTVYSVHIYSPPKFN